MPKPIKTFEQLFEAECLECDRVFSGKSRNAVKMLLKLHNKKKHNYVKDCFNEGYDVISASEEVSGGGKIPPPKETIKNFTGHSSDDAKIKSKASNNI